MVRRFAKLPIVAGACLIAGVLIGVSLSPVIAQQMAAADGQVALRSDGAIYLIANGQRRWIAPVVITDAEINAYPEGEPIFSGVAALPPQAPPAPPPPPSAQPSPPVPAAPAPAPAPPPPPPPVPAPPPPAPAGAVPPANQVAAPPPAPAPPPPPPAGQVSAVPQGNPVPAGTPTGAISEIDPLLPIEVDIDGSNSFERGDQMHVVVKTKAGASCEMAIRWPDGNLADESSQIADNRGRCSYSIKIPANTGLGIGTLTGTVLEGGRTSKQTVEYQVFANL